MTTETVTFNSFAYMLRAGETFFANGTWEVVDFTAPEAQSGVWVYTRSGESYYYLKYATVKVLAV